jgi:hypothetical protein
MDQSVLKRLLSSRRVWLALLGVFGTVLSVGLKLDPAIIVSINGLVVLLIGMFTVDDTAEKNAKARVDVAQAETESSRNYMEAHKTD